MQTKRFVSVEMDLKGWANKFSTPDSSKRLSLLSFMLLSSCEYLLFLFCDVNGYDNGQEFCIRFIVNERWDGHGPSDSIRKLTTRRTSSLRVKTELSGNKVIANYNMSSKVN